MSSKTSRITERKSPASKVIPSTPNSTPSDPIYFWRPQEASTGYLSQWYTALPGPHKQGQNPRHSRAVHDAPQSALIQRHRDRISNPWGEFSARLRSDERLWKLGNTDAEETMQVSSFRDVLLATGTRELVEVSPHDRIWGVEFAVKGAERNRVKWGLSLLGKRLMEVREQFRREAEEDGGKT